MSSPLTITSTGLTQVAAALVAMAAIREKHGVHLGAYGNLDIEYLNNEGREAVFSVRWDDASKQYVIDDRIGV